MSRSKARRLADLIRANLDRLTVDTTTNAVKVVDETDTEVEVVEAGSGVTLDGKTVSLDIDGLTAESSIASTDLLTIHDVSAGTVVKATIADAVANVTDPNALSAGDNVSALTNDAGYITGSYLPTSGGTMTGELQVNARLDVGTGSNADHEIRIYKGDNNVSDHIQFYNGTTRVGEIGVQDTSWLRLNQVTANNIYTPRYFRADGGLYVDSVSRITSGGNSYLNITYNHTGAGGVRLYDSQGVIQSYWYGSGTGEGGLLDNDGNWFVRARTGSNNNYIYCNNNPEVYIYTTYCHAPGSFRSPIFYDSNNTAYYTNPASTSVMNSIYLEGAMYHNGDTNTYIQFHAADQWRVVTGGAERLEVNNTNTTVANNLIARGVPRSANTGLHTSAATMFTLPARSFAFLYGNCNIDASGSGVSFVTDGAQGNSLSTTSQSGSGTWILFNENLTTDRSIRLNSGSCRWMVIND